MGPVEVEHHPPRIVGLGRVWFDDANFGKIDFDLDLAKEQSDENPVMKVKYAHARICSLLAKAVRFKDLGLLVVDEEHRFGVRHKERLKQMKRLVDVLTLTATPIPRTLHMSLVGVRDISNLETPVAFTHVTINFHIHNPIRKLG